MKVFKRILLITSISIGVLYNISFAQTGKVLVEATRVREKANTDSNIVTVIYENEEVEILEESGEWYKIKYNDVVGYAKQNFFKVSASNNSQTTNQPAQPVQDTTQTNTQDTNQDAPKNEEAVSQPVQTPENVQNSNQVVQQEQSQGVQLTSNILVNSNVALRALPSFMSSIIEQIDTGKKLTKIGEMNKWIQVTDGILIGWIPNVKVLAENTQPVETPQAPTQDTPEEEAQNNNREQNSNQLEQPDNTNPSEEKQQDSKLEEKKPQQTNKTGIVNVETANVRKTASQQAERVGILDYGDTITITGEEDDWYKITRGSVSGYVKKSLITEKNISSRSLSEERKDNTTIDETSNKNINDILTEGSKASSRKQEVVDYAKQYLGTKYVLGGRTPESGFDCSGFTKYVFSNFGYTLESTAANQSNIGTEVSRENLEPGDLILFYDEAKSKIGHTGIYISNGDFIHAANAKRGVVIDNLNTNTYYKERFITAKRIVE